MILDCSFLALEQVIETVFQRIDVLLERQATNPRQRMLIALAGIPGSGKSTISSGLMRKLSKKNAGFVAVVPMDGFHYSKAALALFPDPCLAVRRRGAPFTFDAAAFVQLVMKLKEAPVTFVDESVYSIRAPSFDHRVQDPVADDIEISSRNRIVILEGNYTLFNQTPWNQIGNKVDERWFVDVSPEVAKERLVERHLQAGIECSRELALTRVENNDLLNADLIKRHLLEPNLIISC
ncbi:hypothetical protein LTR84_001785 [Exophiala bonariae]|uniref:Phosphoribulokinase/uridine kinase domain-containing protein n=1 Tax=Exophiala bonariae TaxID=1690606 RepID=A0AAV9NBG2_9EURO|nr:hypothetical protein LTR84_001785 [Exophiala bonariae]